MTDPENAPNEAAAPARIKLSPEAARRVAQERASTMEGPRMLPGMAMIAIFLLFYAGVNAFAAYRGMFGYGPGRWAALGICTLFVAGVFGFLRLRRWGWALMLGGTLFLAMYDVVQFIRSHAFVLLVQALFATVFFLYLVRDEVRRRVH